MNQWVFVIAAYAVAVAGTIGLALLSFIAMRRVEARSEKLRRDR